MRRIVLSLLLCAGALLARPEPAAAGPPWQIPDEIYKALRPPLASYLPQHRGVSLGCPGDLITPAHARLDDLDGGGIWIGMPRLAFHCGASATSTLGGGAMTTAASLHGLAWVPSGEGVGVAPALVLADASARVDDSQVRVSWVVLVAGQARHEATLSHPSKLAGAAPERTVDLRGEVWMWLPVPEDTWGSFGLEWSYDGPVNVSWTAQYGDRAHVVVETRLSLGGTVIADLQETPSCFLFFCVDGEDWHVDEPFTVAFEQVRAEAYAHYESLPEGDRVVGDAFIVHDLRALAGGIGGSWWLGEGRDDFRREPPSPYRFESEVRRPF